MINFYTTNKQRTANCVLPQLAVTCKTEAECYYQTFVLGDSEVLRNRKLRQHAKRYILSNNDFSNKFGVHAKFMFGVRSVFSRYKFYLLKRDCARFRVSLALNHIAMPFSLKRPARTNQRFVCVLAGLTQRACQRQIKLNVVRQ